jgi:hypothetical protein
MSTKKWTVRENLTTNAAVLGHGGLTDKEYQVKMNKSTVSGTLPLWNSKDPEPDPYQSEKQASDPYQNGLDPQHW